LIVSFKEPSVTKERLAALCLRLPPEDRADLAKNLLRSLEEPAEEDVAILWYKEAERRFKEYDEGKVKARSLKAVMRRAKARMSCRKQVSRRMNLFRQGRYKEEPAEEVLKRALAKLS
jgi:putative addiction module component (TIGR02574 family)